jgi:hypothetical protein
MQTGIIECPKCDETTEIEDIDNLIELVCSCGYSTKGKSYPVPSTTLFTKRHYEWLVQMSHELGLTHKQVKLLSTMLVGTNNNYQSKRFRTEFTLYSNSNSGGI